MKNYEIWDAVQAILDSDDTNEEALRKIKDLLNKELKD